MKPIFDITLVKFLLVGVINTVVGAGTMFLLYNLAHCSYWISSMANYLVGGIVSFVLNKYFTFRNTTWQWGQVFKFAINLLVCYFAGYWLAQKCVYILLPSNDVAIKDNIAMGLGMVLYTLLNYFGQKFWAFKD